MPRQPRSEIAALKQEVRAMELLADEIEVAPADLQMYWEVAASLITLSSDVEDFGSSHPMAGEDDPEVLELRRRLRAIASQLMELSVTEDG